MRVRREPMSFLERLYFPEIFRGMGVTLRHLFRRNITLQYPEEKPVLPPGYRGAPTLVRDQDGRTKCVACQLCEFVCPPKAIRIVPRELPEDNSVEKEPEVFEIDMLRCIYCGYCEEVCPEDAIVLQQEYSLTGTNRREMVFDKEKLLDMGGVIHDPVLKWRNK